jgi:DNA repair protein RadC
VRGTTDARQISLMPPEAASLLHLVRENLRLLASLAGRYEVSGLTATTERPTVRNPADVAAYLGTELSDLAQEQLRVVLLST